MADCSKNEDFALELTQNPNYFDFHAATAFYSISNLSLPATIVRLYLSPSHGVSMYQMMRSDNWATTHPSRCMPPSTSGPIIPVQRRTAPRPLFLLFFTKIRNKFLFVPKYLLNLQRNWFPGGVR